MRRPARPKSFYFQIENLETRRLLSAAPVQMTAQVGDGSVQRSIVHDVTLTFGAPVVLGSGALTLARRNTGGSGANDGSSATDLSADITVSNPSGDQMTWIVSFLPNSPATDSGGTLADGVYDLSVHASEISLPSNSTLTDQTITFFRLYGDINGDGAVNNSDYFRFRKAYGTSAADPNFDDGFDDQRTGSISNADFLIFRKNYDKQFNLNGLIAVNQSGAAVVQPPPSASGNNWRLIFDDEFSGNTLSPIWHPAQYWDATYSAPGPGELQTYAPSAVSVSNGLLHLTATPDTTYGTPYVSGMVEAGGVSWDPAVPSFSFLHGYMEVRAQIPAGQGLFPGIWMLPASHNDDNGEIDDFEAIGSYPSNANFALHRNGIPEGHDWQGPDFSAGFHTFGVDWEANRVSWYIDGALVGTSRDPSLICPEAMFPILNLAVGGDWPGPPDSTTPFPATMLVDYVRIWQDPANP